MIRPLSFVCRYQLPLLAALLLLAADAHAAVKPNPLFSDNAVLQQGRKVPVWGTANEGEEVIVKFQDQTVTAKAKDGRWQVALENLKPGGPFEMTIAGENTITLKNILVGEVWIASGQSNMQWSVKQSADPDKTIAESANPNLRLFTVPRVATDEPQSTVDAAWVECGPQTVPEFSAVAYHFGQMLQSKLEVPVGIINTSYGGTPAEAWTSREALAAVPELKSLLDMPPAGTTAVQRPTGLYNAMIHPLLPYAISGAIWYQGESNAGRAAQYFTLFPTMIANWRQAWNQGDFPFLFVQLAPFMKKVDEPRDSQWAELREAQRHTLKQSPNTGMAVITDVGDETDIHPKAKKPVGERLALAALAKAYGKDVAYSGPAYRDAEFKGAEAVLNFDHVAGGLVASGDKLEGFTIAGKDQKFHKANAEIRGEQVVVSCPDVAEPVAVRYGWADYPVVNLANQAGLLASPFRTDDFPLTTAPKPTQ
ncbi:MAG: sialate O-acetylesterase [Pirellulales bacterium]|nr:sialate O-acetylesterase [Pirellulales bacterium]